MVAAEVEFMLLRHQLLTMEELLLEVLLVVPLLIVPQCTKHVNIAGVQEIVVVAMEKDTSSTSMVAMRICAQAVTDLADAPSVEAQEEYRQTTISNLKHQKL